MKYFLYALTLAFIVLKVMGYIDLSWWFALCPLIVLITFYAFAIVLAIWAEVLKARNKSVNQFTAQRKSKFQEKLDNYMKQQMEGK